MTDMLSVASQIVLTLAYSDQFAHPLTATEVYQRLISVKSGKVPFSVFVRTLMHLRKQGIVRMVGEYWSIRSVNAAQKLVALRHQRELLSLQKITSAQPLISILNWLPWVRGVAVTGSAAVLSADTEDDLDFMIVTKRRRLWLVRVLVVIISLLAGKRRTWHREEPNSWCFNLWLEEDQLVVPYSQRSLYTAYEVVQTRWVGEYGQTAQHFYNSNTWIHQFLPHVHAAHATAATRGTSTDTTYLAAITARTAFTWLELLLSPVWDGLNYLAYLLQLFYMQQHKTRERVGFSFAFFHPRDTHGSIMAGWRVRLASQLQK